MEEDVVGSSGRRASSRARKVAPKMGAALSDSNNRSLATLSRLDALESDNVAVEVADPDDAEEASLDDEDQQVFTQKKLAKSAKRKTRQAKALEKLENAKKAPRNFLELLHEANLEAVPSHIPTYHRAAVGPPSSAARRHFCSVCGYFANYTCTLCGARFCSCRCRKMHSDTRCQKFVS